MRPRRRVSAPDPPMTPAPMTPDPQTPAELSDDDLDAVAGGCHEDPNETTDSTGPPDPFQDLSGGLE